MITLFGFGPAFNLIDPSPFVTKIDLTLRIHGIEFECVNSSSNLQKAPKSKLPFIDDDGQIIADSVFILDHINQKYKVDLDAWLTEEQKAMSQLTGKSLDENLYWTIVHSRWLNDDVWPAIKSQFFDPLPFPMNHLIASYARRSTRKQLIGHGMGKHSDEEIALIANRSCHSLSILLGDKPFFFGDQMSSLDVTAYAMLSAFTLSSIETALDKHVNGYNNLVDFTQRIAHTYYPKKNIGG